MVSDSEPDLLGPMHSARSTRKVVDSRYENIALFGKGEDNIIPAGVHPDRL